MSLVEQIPSVEDANGKRWVYRRVSSVLERRSWSSAIWDAVQPSHFMFMTPAELRHVADVLEKANR